MELDFALLALRLIAGLIFVAHGAQKAFGWWGGPGPAGWRGAMEHMHFRPPALFAIVSTGIELVGGSLLALGLLTPLAVAALTAQTVVIILVAHLPRGFWTTNGGIEFPLTLATMLVALAATGAGGASLDAVLGLAYGSPLRWQLLLLGLAAGLAVVGYAKLAARTVATAAR